MAPDDPRRLGKVFLSLSNHRYAMGVPECVFETLAYEGMPVVLSRGTWQAKAGNDAPGDHPEIRGYLEDMKAAIESPDLVFRSTRDERSKIFYHLRAGRGEFAGKHLVVIVTYVQQARGQRGYVSTAYLSRAVYSRGVYYGRERGKPSINHCPV